MNTAGPTPDAQANHGQLPLIIIGAGLAGWSVAREFRKLDADTPVLMITLDSGDFYAKPSLSNAFAQGRAPTQLVSSAAAKMSSTQNVTLLPHTRVISIDSQAQVVRTSQGDHPYRQLVLASGAQAIRVPLGGDAADQVLSVNSLDDFTAFHARLTADSGAQPKHVMIMGAGLIGCEFANDLIGAGYQVSVADPAVGPMAALLPAEAGEQLKTALSSLGVQWHFGSTASAVNQAHEMELGQRLDITLSSGATLQADVVLSAIGLRADLTLASAAGLRCERGVVVDDLLQTSASQIYALGDAAQYAGGRVLPYVMPIMNAAKALAQTLAGTPTPVVFPLMPVAIKTPALPLVAASPAPGASGAWHAVEAGVWQYKDASDAVRGFVLAGGATNRRAEQSSLVQAP
ncbi:FAD-dependent oxidoreductase [Rhodoferax sp. PAMC 29310]|uniref:FAD-dependent oxidoreductase n=1 Tax=Rhodoferax sp. PAMC 29310 TaxID=2822760 RepID=UPI001B331156|nr:FAD-dependent oxidoreductase [Rhodoferax sp. PAMC 29310]